MTKQQKGFNKNIGIVQNSYESSKPQSLAQLPADRSTWNDFTRLTTRDQTARPGTDQPHRRHWHTPITMNQATRNAFGPMERMKPTAWNNLEQTIATDDDRSKPPSYLAFLAQNHRKNPQPHAIYT